LVNNVLDNFYLFIDDQVEAPTAEEKCSRNTYIVADVALMRALERLAQWKDTDGIALQSHQYEAAQIRELSRKRGLSVGEENQHRHQLMLLEQHIHALVDERKNLENDIKLKRAWWKTEWHRLPRIDSLS
jgi:hypothetical protein